jgi:hypothetical protein
MQAPMDSIKKLCTRHPHHHLRFTCKRLDWLQRVPLEFYLANQRTLLEHKDKTFRITSSYYLKDSTSTLFSKVLLCPGVVGTLTNIAADISACLVLSLVLVLVEFTLPANKTQCASIQYQRESPLQPLCRW